MKKVIKVKQVLSIATKKRIVDDILEGNELVGLKLPIIIELFDKKIKVVAKIINVDREL